MDKVELLDRLNRAYIMEEQMTGLLVDLCQPIVLPDDLSQAIRKRIIGILASIKADTVRHKEIIFEIKKSLA